MYYSSPDRSKVSKTDIHLAHHSLNEHEQNLTTIQPIPKDEHPPAIVTRIDARTSSFPALSTRHAGPTTSFPAVSRFFGALIIVARIPFVHAGGIGDELSNNIISDFAPFLALFGEQVTKQFMSQSMGVADNIIFAVAPLGIITAIVGAIRVGGPKSLTAIIGRARESRSAVEIELMSSTSTDVCELWDGMAVVRALGAPPIIELIYVTPRDIEYGVIAPETLKIWTEGNFGIYDFDTAIASGQSSILELASTNNPGPPGDRSRGSAPNLSLNIGGNTIPDIEFVAVAAFGVMLQLGVIAFVVLIAFLPPWRSEFQKEGYVVAVHAPLVISGTLALVIGMYLCSHIIDRSTTEESWKVKEIAQAQVQVAWLQKGGVVNDQVFHSYALFPPVLGRENSPRTQLVGLVMRLFSNIHHYFPILQRFIWDKLAAASRFFLHVLTSSWCMIYSARILRTVACVALIPVIIVECLVPSYLSNAIVRAFYGFADLLRRFATLAQSVSRVLGATSRVLRVLSPFQRKWRAPSGMHRNRNPRLSIRTSRQTKTSDQYSVVVIAVMVSLFGFVAQLLGLRGMHWSVTVSQLGATAIMTVLRATIRRNIIHNPRTEKLNLGYELDWMAREGIKKCTRWSVVTWGFDRPIQQLPENTVAAATMTARRRLAALSKWPSQWHATVDSTTDAIQETMNFMFSNPDITLKGDWSTLDHWEWKVVIEVGVRGSDTTSLEEITLSLKRTKLLDGPWGPWRVVKSEIEAVLGLWMLHFKDLESTSAGDESIPITDISDWQNEEDGLLRGKPILRILGPYDGIGRMVYDHWIGRQTNYVKVKDIDGLTQGDARACHMVIAQSSQNPQPNTPVLGVITTTALERICGQVIYSVFMSNLSDHITIGGKVTLQQGDRGDKSSFGLSCASLLGLVEIVERVGLADTEEAYISITPALSRSGNLPISPNNTQALFHGIIGAINSRIADGQLDDAEMWLLWLLHSVELAVDVYISQCDWRNAGEVYLQLRRESEKLLQKTDHFEDIDRRIALFCEGVFVSIAPSPTVVGSHRPMLSKTLDLVGTCMASVLGQISEITLVKWKRLASTWSAAVGVWGLSEAARDGNGLRLELLLLEGLSSTEECGNDRRTPLIEACIAGHAAVVGQLIRYGADTNTKDYRDQTPLHHASQRGHTSVVQLLLLSGGLAINSRDRMGQSALDYAVQQNVGQIVKLLLFYGAEDLNGKAKGQWHTASVNGSEAGINQMIDKGLDLNMTDGEYGRTPLHWAVWNASDGTVKRLIEIGVKVDLKDQCGDSPLHIAAMGGSMVVVKRLLSKRVMIDATGERQETSLHRAASVGSELIVDLLLANKAHINARDESQQTPIHLAAQNGHTETAQLLINRGANQWAKDDSQRTALHHAAFHGHTAMANLLLERGCVLEDRANQQLTALQYAASNGHTKTAELLIDLDADIETRDDSQNTPLHHAASAGHTATVELLLNAGAETEVRDDSRMTPLHHAAWNGHTATLQLLLDHGAANAAKNISQQTPLHFAASNGYTATAQLLLDWGTNKEAKDDSQKTPLHDAVSNGHTNTARLLIDRGSEIDARNDSQRTPLHFAASDGHITTVQLLLERGAEKEANDNSQRTPLHEAAVNGHTPTVQLLLDWGADKSAKCNSQLTPLHYAASKGHTATVRLLLDRRANRNAVDIMGYKPVDLARSGDHMAAVERLER